ncbi:MAG: GNAT family N-acetyltransferase, partial [Acidimicrobiia bacterium]|nr:GNAT family N-acetyltransferase [Acidimicrobiia bacterium]
PAYAFPESAARTLARVLPYVRWRATPPGRPPCFEDLHLSAARAIVERAPLSGDGWLRPLDALALLDAFAIAHVPTVAVCSEAQAADLARRLGFPVAVKGAGPAIVHKSEAHAVATNLIADADVRRAYAALAARRGRDIDQVLLQPMAYGAEFLVGAVADPAFGHVVVCGSGGRTAELVRDTACGLHPLTDTAAQGLLDRVRATALLRGFRGTPPGGEPALRDVLLRVSALVDACPEVVELDLNPVIVGPAGATVADARIRILRKEKPS